MYQCAHCMRFAVTWINDFDFEDYGLEGEGIVKVMHCNHCVADIEYYIKFDQE